MWFGLKALVSPFEIVLLMDISTPYVETFYDVGSKRLPAGRIYTGNHMYGNDVPVIVVAPDSLLGFEGGFHTFQYWEHEPTGTKVYSPILKIEKDGDWWANYSVKPPLRGFWFYGGQNFNEIAEDFAGKKLDCNAVWLWRPEAWQVELCLKKGWKVFVVVGSGKVIYPQDVENWKDYEVVFVVDDWVGGSEPLEELREMAPKRKIGLNGVIPSQMDSIPPELYDYLFFMHYPIHKWGFNIECWIQDFENLKAYKFDKPFYVWIQVFANDHIGGYPDWRIPEPEELEILLQYSKENCDGIFFFLPERANGMTDVTDDLMNHPELWAVINKRI